MCWRASRGSLLRVLVVGAGGLGSPSLLYLAAAGVGAITVIDDDAVDVRDLAAWVVTACEQRTTGAYDGTGTATPPSGLCGDRAGPVRCL